MRFKDLLLEAKSSKYLFVSFEAGGKEEALRKKFKSATFASWSDLSIENGEVLALGKPLTNFTWIVVGVVGDHVQLHSCLKAEIEAKKLKSIFYGSSTELNNKLLQTVKMSQLKVPQVNTVITTADTANAEQLVKKLGLPVVSKIFDGSQGKGVKKHDSKESLAKVLNGDKPLIFQAFVPNDGDYRLFFVKQKLIYAIKRKSGSEKEFRNNISLGGSYEYVDLEPKALKIAERAVKAMGFDFTGVDLIQNKDTGEWFVMEINSAPQFNDDDFDMVMNEIVRLIK
jgi:ribosomal protein S6--L-glutamate ligase